MQRTALFALSLAAVALIFVVAGSLYAIAAAVLLVGRVGLAVLHRPLEGDPTGLRTAALVTAYNEDPAALRACIESLVGQVDRIVVVDDGSREGLEAHRALDGLDVQLVRHELNVGKRVSLIEAARIASDADVYVTVDSDTVVEPGAVYALLSPIAAGAIAAAGAVHAANRRGLLSRMLDARYTAAFHVDRASQAALDAVLCCCGAFAAYRFDVLVNHEEDFLEQTFLGQRCNIGDDRRLTSIALRYGSVDFVGHARARTMVPERLGHWLRQQLRWTRSWARESWLMARNASSTRAWAVNLAEVVLGVGFTAAIGVKLALIALNPTWPAVIGALIGGMLISWLRAFPYLTARQDLSVVARLGGFALAPLYTLLHIVTLMPLRIIALSTLRNQGWGTRQDGVEVGLKG